MAYSLELDDLRQEVRKDTASTVIWWPKIDGAGNITASAVAGQCTYEIRDAANIVVQASANITPTVVTSIGSRFDFSIPAIATMAEDYFVLLTWQVAGETFVHTQTIFFDVVREVWGPSTVSLQVLQTLQPDIGDRILRQAARLSQTDKQRASSIGHLARVELGEWIRASVTADVARILSSISAPRTTTTFTRPLITDGYLRPRLIKDKSRLSTVEAKLAVSIAYRSDARAGDDDDEAPADAVAAMAKDWLEQARASFMAMGALRYDLDEDLTADTLITPATHFVNMRRVQS